MKTITPLQQYVLTTMSFLKQMTHNHLDDILSNHISVILQTINTKNAEYADWVASLKHYFRLKLITSDSMFGTTLKGILREYDVTPNSTIQPYQIVLKTASEESENYTVRYEFDILHEVIIGYSLNTLKKETNCFASMIGYLFKKQNKQYHAVNIQSYIQGTTICNLLKTQTIVPHKQLLFQTIIQLAHALHIAQTNFSFMHWDLHGENVICMPCYQPQTITCKFNETVSITLHNVAFIPVCIDFGMSTILLHNELVPNKYFAANPTEDKNVLWLSVSKESCFLPIFDLYRYLTYCFVKSYLFPPSLIECFFSYLFHTENMCDPILQESLNLLKKGEYDSYKTHYTRNKCSNPHKDNGQKGSIFKEGNLIDWVKNIISLAPTGCNGEDEK